MHVLKLVQSRIFEVYVVNKEICYFSKSPEKFKSNYLIIKIKFSIIICLSHRRNRIHLIETRSLRPLQYTYVPLGLDPIDHNTAHRSWIVAIREFPSRRHHGCPNLQSPPIYTPSGSLFIKNWNPYLSLAIPLMKHITQGRTLISNFSTNQGIFSTNTRKKRVLKYLGASA